MEFSIKDFQRVKKFNLYWVIRHGNPTIKLFSLIRIFAKIFYFVSFKWIKLTKINGRNLKSILNLYIYITGLAFDI